MRAGMGIIKYPLYVSLPSLKKEKTQKPHSRATQEECGIKKDRSLNPCCFSAVRLHGCHSTFPSSHSFICKVKIITGSGEIF